MIVTSPLVLGSLALFASMFHQTLSFELPIPTRHEQCVADGYEGACDFTNSDKVIEYRCKQLRCARLVGVAYFSLPVYVQRYSKKPLEGTYCGPSSYCSNERCIYSEEESKKLQYTGPEYKVTACN